MIRSASVSLALFLCPSVLVAVPYDCGSTSYQQAVEAAREGDRKALYWVGSGLDIGECGVTDKTMASDFLHASAAQRFPPAEHLLGVIARRDGRQAESIEHFERAAKLGYRLAEADIGFTYMQPDSHIHSKEKAYGWLQLAASRPEIDERQRQYLDISLEGLRRELGTSGGLRAAEAEAKRVSEELAYVPVWVDE